MKTIKPGDLVRLKQGFLLNGHSEHLLLVLETDPLSTYYYILYEFISKKRVEINVNYLEKIS